MINDEKHQINIEERNIAGINLSVGLMREVIGQALSTDTPDQEPYHFIALKRRFKDIQKNNQRMYLEDKDLSLPDNAGTFRVHEVYDRFVRLYSYDRLNDRKRFHTVNFGELFDSQNRLEIKLVD